MNTDNITVNTQSSIRIKGSRKVLYFDPFKIEGNPGDADFIFLTHDHYDHFSPEDIIKVAKPDTVYVFPERMKDAVEAFAMDEKHLIPLSPLVVKEYGDIVIRTVPAYNTSLIKPFHKKNEGFLGYEVKMDNTRYYISGDTDETSEAIKNVKCDVAIVPIGGTYTMDAKKAADFVNKLKPEIAIPTHYGSIVGKAEDAETFRKNVNKSIKVVIKIEQ
ncbi:MAG: MBL fold metallo-hydrolase [Butyrivibrio sp.]|nr:MBL fold metallo-hydrolase [Butyrivibrio sp.]